MMDPAIYDHMQQQAEKRKKEATMNPDMNPDIQTGKRIWRWILAFVIIASLVIYFV